MKLVMFATACLILAVVGCSRQDDPLLQNPSKSYDHAHVHTHAPGIEHDHEHLGQPNLTHSHAHHHAAR